MDVSKIFLIADEEEAQRKFAQYKFLDGFNTLLIGPTDIFRITGQAPNKIEWKSGADHDWYMVVVTEATVWTAGDGVVEGPD
ncbi:hypothetical protein [Pseudoxanthomonas sacheonensis]|uniref:Uncharacterized protein n=1 Tax=Pseudoxanthomonas sacheonensis TaxID=443615 RepID=A0ABU1RSC2_9GAMM|nr:hypothetical protein [Pseudoxanthomonas sacheonensis]MDR6841200.1 hypothetical protein [Pseudoxanthomonas sacheonensis]